MLPHVDRNRSGDVQRVGSDNSWHSLSIAIPSRKSVLFAIVAFAVVVWSMVASRPVQGQASQSGYNSTYGAFTSVVPLLSTVPVSTLSVTGTTGTITCAGNCGLWAGEGFQLVGNTDLSCNSLYFTAATVSNGGASLTFSTNGTSCTGSGAGGSFGQWIGALVLYNAAAPFNSYFVCSPNTDAQTACSVLVAGVARASLNLDSNGGWGLGGSAGQNVSSDVNGNLCFGAAVVPGDECPSTDYMRFDADGTLTKYGGVTLDLDGLSGPIVKRLDLPVTGNLGITTMFTTPPSGYPITGDYVLACTASSTANVPGATVQIEVLYEDQDVGFTQQNSGTPWDFHSSGVVSTFIAQLHVQPSQPIQILTGGSGTAVFTLHCKLRAD